MSESTLNWGHVIVLNLDALVNCLPKKKDRSVMERYLDEQPLSKIAKAIGISCSKVEENSTDPVSAMAEKER